MSRHRRFSDSAGFTRHCWECVHAKDWETRSVTGDWATCELTGRHVGKCDSPNNICSRLPAGCEYDDGMDK